MNGRVMEILNFLIKLILKDESPAQNEAGIIQELLEKGYTPTEIETAFGLIFSASEETEEDDKPSLGRVHSYRPYRVLNYEERLKLSLEAQGFLTSLVEAGLLERGELEELLLYLEQVDAFEMGIGEVSWILERVVRDEERLALITGATIGRRAVGRYGLLN